MALHEKSRMVWHQVELSARQQYSQVRHGSSEKQASEPQALQSVPYSLLLLDVLLTLVPLAFVVLGGLALFLDTHTVSALGQSVLEAQKFGPTLFPIVFAALLGRLMTNAARWRAEKGSRLGVLELLSGSQSLFSALQRVLCLRDISLLSLVIVILWALSPIGGQSSLRLLSITQFNATTFSDLRYLDTNMSFGSETYSALASVAPQASALFTGALLASPEVRGSAMDIWGNVKIPMIEPLERAGASTTPGDWITVPNGRSQLESYSSLVGILVAGLTDVGFANFSVQSSYTTLDCPSISPCKYTSSGNHSIESTHVGSITPFSYPGSGLPQTPFIVDTWLNQWANGHPNIYFVSFGAPLQTFPACSNCSMGFSHVESNILCSGRSCAVARMRRSLLDTRPRNLSPFPEDSEMARETFERLMTSFPYMVGTNFVDGGNQPATNPIYTYLLAATKNILTESSARKSASTATVSPLQLSVRLTQLWNAYLQVLWASNYISGGWPSTQNVSAYGNQTEPWRIQSNQYSPLGLDGGIVFPNNISRATIVQPDTDRYVASRLWCGILLVMSLILELCAILGLVLKYLCNGPSILGYASSLTRDNPYVLPNVSANNLDGLDRARVLKDMVVQVGDVRSDEDVGHIALKDQITEPLKRDRQRRYL